MDLIMMTHFNGFEREIDDWKALFAQADQRLKIKGIAQPSGSTNSIIELVFEE
jgi:hypothetical protein